MRSDKINLNKIMHNNKAVFLAYDQGLEHGPESDFNDKNVDPNYIIDIAKKGKFNALIFHKGIAEKYSEEIKKSKVPLIVKLNGKTKIVKGEPISSVVCTVDEAVKLGAAAVGFTIYIGSEFETEIFEDFGEIANEAHTKGLPVVAWIYPRGKAIKNDVSREMISYAARTGLELGADIVKLKYGGNKDDLAWAVKSAGRTKVVVAGGVKKSGKDFISQVKDIIDAGASGLAVGRNVWQAAEPMEIAKAIRRVVFGKT